MTDLTFADRLVVDQFSYHNEYIYTELRDYGLYFDETSDTYPYIMTSNLSNKKDLQYSSYANQLGLRVLNLKKLKDILNSAQIPIICSVRHVQYLIGKGFLSTYDATEGKHDPLIVACVNKRKSITGIVDVRIYISRKINQEIHKAFHPIVKDLTAEHQGDIIICNNILEFIGERIEIPRGGSLTQRKEYEKALIEACFREAWEVQVKETKTKVQEILEAAGMAMTNPDSSLPF
jgi:hypothetical protein